MSGQHSQRDRWGRKTDADGDVTSISGVIEDAEIQRPYVPKPE